MGFIRGLFYRLTHSNKARMAVRSLLKTAKTENREQYLVLAAMYIDLANTYYGCSFSEPLENRSARVTQLFLGLWQNLRYAERFSDFEYMLAAALIESTSEHHAITSSRPLVTKLRLLSPQTRFAYLAHAFGNWPLRWIALVMRFKSPQLHQLLSEAHCELCGVSWESLANEERSCLVAISASLAKKPNVLANKELHKRTRYYPRVNEIKAQWLELRPELVEVRIRYTLSQDEREQLLANILAAIAEAPMQQPQLVDRMMNSVHFSRHAKILTS
jgi:hypothetical protein